MNGPVDILYNNVNGLTSKKDSLHHILEMRKPDVVALCETKLHANSNLEIDNYKTVKSNLKAGKEGLLIAARKGTFDSIELVYESECKRIATAEIQYPEDVVRVIVVTCMGEIFFCFDNHDGFAWLGIIPKLRACGV